VCEIRILQNSLICSVEEKLYELTDCMVNCIYWLLSRDRCKQQTDIMIALVLPLAISTRVRMRTVELSESGNITIID
jgi:hypothetical protein